MADDTFRDRFLAALDRSDMSVAELSRRSGVNYHTIDKLKNGISVSTSADNARKLAAALGMDNNQGEEVNRLVAMFLSMDADKRAALLTIAQTLAAT